MTWQVPSDPGGVGTGLTAGRCRDRAVARVAAAIVVRTGRGDGEQAEGRHDGDGERRADRPAGRHVAQPAWSWLTTASTASWSSSPVARSDDLPVGIEGDEVWVRGQAVHPGRRALGVVGDDPARPPLLGQPRRRRVVGEVRLHARGDGDEVDVLGDRPVGPPLHETRDLGPAVRAPVGDEHHETGPAGGAADRLGRAVEALPVEHRRGGPDGRVVGAVARELGERVARHGDGLDLGDPAGRGLVVGVVASELGDGNSAEEDDGDDDDEDRHQREPSPGGRLAALPVERRRGTAGLL